MKNTKLKKIISVLIVVLTLGFFASFIHSHPQSIQTLQEIDSFSLVLLSVAYTLAVLSNALILHYSLSYVRSKIPFLDNFLLTGYSSIINFFGPLQSGPGFRAVYLRKKYKIEISKILTATLIFYLFYGLINASILYISAIFKWFFLVYILLLLIIIFTLLHRSIFRLMRKNRYLRALIESVNVNKKQFWLIVLSTVLLIGSTWLIYAVELYQIAPQTSPIQSLIYTSAANLSLFVSLTPGAIGFRESFLVLSQQLHNIPTSTIISANILDRGFYIFYLFILFILLRLISWRMKRQIYSSLAERSPYV